LFIFFIFHIGDVLDVLAGNFEQKSKGYKRGALAQLFLLNNYHYILKILRTSRLSEILGKEMDTKFEKQISKHRSNYHDR